MTTDTDTSTSTNGPVILAVIAAILAVLIAVFALGKALATPIGGVAVTTTDAAAAADEPAPAAGATEADATLNEFSIELSETPLSPDATIAVVNDGGAPHNLAVEGTELTTADLNSGETDQLALGGLAPGSYTFLCTIPGHAAAGMTTEVTIAAGEAAASADTAGQSDDDGHMDSGDPAASHAEKVAAMEASIAAFPAETEGEGAAVLEPTILDDGTKLFELTVDEIQWEVEPGKIVEAVGYNGIVPGPTMYADPGDRVTIRVINELDFEGTSLHPHGLKDHEFALDGVTFVSQDPIAPGDAMDYTFVAGEESVMTYHSHHMSLHQVPNGLFGAMIIGDYAGLAGYDDVVDEQVMILNDAGNIGFSLNGKSFPATKPYSYKVGDKVLVHYANEGQMAHPMHLHNQTGTVIAKDGYLLPEGARYQGDTFNVAPGERLSVVYEMNTPGTWVWHCHILSHVKRADGTMFGMLTAVIVEE